MIVTSRKRLQKLISNRRYLVDELKYKLTAGKSAKVSYPPRSLTIGIIGACYFRCSYCALFSEDARDNEKTYRTPFRLKLKDFKRVVDWAYRGKIRHVHVCAIGEPFIHDQILDMLDYVIEKYGKVSFQTDFGTKLFDDGYYLDEILKRKDKISYITTDILSWDKNEHESVKIGSDFDKLLEYLRYISMNSEIIVSAHHLLTHKNYKDLYRLPMILKENRINFSLDVVNLHPYDFNEWTALKNVYTSKDTAIKEELDRLAQYCKENDITYSIPAPFDKGEKKCQVFWSRIQIMPIKTLPKDKWVGNAIPGYCNAVVNGNLITMGNIFDYDNVMDFWNNPQLVEIRQNLLDELYPSEACMNCQNFAGHRPTKEIVGELA